MGRLPGALRPRQPGKRARLTYVLGKYASQIEADFAREYPQHNVGTLWRSRRWRFLLNLIDHLPQNTWYHAAVSTDVDHAVMLLKAQEEAKRKGAAGPPSGPSMRSWSPEVDVGHKILDAVNGVGYAVAKSNGGNVKPPKPAPRPPTAMETARLRYRNEKHAILVRRMLPHQYRDDD